MMVKASAAIFIFYVSSSWCAIENRPPSWLDRMVLHYKKLFLAEVSKMPAVPFQATIEKAPPGYVDSPAWDFDSVMRLLTLIQSSGNKPMKHVIHEVLKPTRRLFVAPGRNKFKIFPSLAKEHIDNFYYDGVDSAEYWASDEVNVFNASDTSAIILVSNPVESRLPSARISVDLLKDIMMTRALAAREMPSSSNGITTKASGTEPGAASTKVDPNAPATSVDPKAPASSVDPNAPATTVDPNAPVTTVDPNAPVTTVDPNAPATTVDPNAPATTVNPNAPATTVDPKAVATTTLHKLLRKKW